MKFTCRDCGGVFDTKHPMHEFSSRKELCGKCCTDKDPPRSYMVIEGIAEGKGYISWVKHGPKDEECYGSNALINRHVNYTQKYQRIGQKKR